ncbi:cytochrome P450 307a1-like [Lycorma delicatula]|uniref:cytochrome P450 307a1-like n=1 Tax=Lycorma delicatula TaxID=130591 RepID=UPI003F512A6D
MESLLTVTATSYFLLVCLLLALWAVLFSRTKDPQEAPGPRAWPVIGSLHLLAGYIVPYQAFSALSEFYGPVFKMYLGSTNCVVVNGLDNIREVLFNKGAHFDGRPNFKRYEILFCGNKGNSLAFCDWSDIQKTRRELLQSHTFPRSFTVRHQQLETYLSEECRFLKEQLSATNGKSFAIKPVLLHCCANLFTSYFCSRHFSINNKEFAKMIFNFDEIFYEVNQGYAADFMPWLMLLQGRHLAKMNGWSREIRKFMEESILKGRLEEWENDPYRTPEDYVDTLIEHIKSGRQPTMSWDMALFSLEDIVGGHSAVGNLFIKILGYIVDKPEVQQKIFEEAEAATQGRDVTLTDRNVMPYTESVILEVIRFIASPIVPHVANQDTTIAGFKVEKDSLIFLNNYDLSMNPSLWDRPEEFIPERFLSSEGLLVKPDHFLPFGGGRRSCMGNKMVQFTCFSFLANIVHKFHIVPSQDIDYHVPIGNLALPYDTYKFCFIPRA